MVSACFSSIPVLETWGAHSSCNTHALDAGLLLDCLVGAKVVEDLESTRITQGCQSIESGLISLSEAASNWREPEHSNICSSVCPVFRL